MFIVVILQVAPSNAIFASLLLKRTLSELMINFIKSVFWNTHEPFVGCSALLLQDSSVSVFLSRPANHDIYFCPNITEV